MDLFGLIRQFKGGAEVEAIYSYKLPARALKDQCNLTEDQYNSPLMFDFIRRW